MLYTASSFISFHGRLEEKTEKFYQSLLDNERCIDAKDTIFTFVKENRKHKERIKRTYQEVITDALESNFPQKYLEEKDYEIDTDITDDLSFIDILNKAIEIEEKCNGFCRDAGESLRNLLADVPEAFIWLSQRKRRRIEKLESLLTAINTI